MATLVEAEVQRLSGFQALHRGGVEVCQTLSDTDRGAPGSVPGSAVGGQVTPDMRLAASAREGEGQIGRMAGTYALMRRPASFGKGSPFRHPVLFYVSLSNVGRGTTPARGAHEEFFLVQDRCRSGGTPLSPGVRYVGQLYMVALAYATFSTPTWHC